MCDAWVAFGGHEVEHGRWDKAKKCYTRALKVAEGRGGCANEGERGGGGALGARLEARRRNPKRARELFVKSVELCETLVSITRRGRRSSSDADGAIRRGVCLNAAPRFVEAVEDGAGDRVEPRVARDPWRRRCSRIGGIRGTVCVARGRRRELLGRNDGQGERIV